MNEVCSNDNSGASVLLLPGQAVTKRLTVAEAEDLLYVQHPVLESTVDGAEAGHWALVDYMGGDASVVEGARTSINFGLEARSIRDDRHLIRYLYENAHTSPFEQVSLKFHCHLPLYVFAQLVRHRTAKLNSASARYSVMKDEFQLPDPGQLRRQGTANKQATDETADPTFAIEASRKIMEYCSQGYALYDELLGPVINPEAPEKEWKRAGIAREQARIVLPQNLMTTIVWKIDLHNLLHFLGLRLDWHAQYEIRVYAEGFAKAARAVAPLSYEAFEEFKLYGQRYSRTDAVFLQHLWAFYVAEVGSDQAREKAVAMLGKRTGKVVQLLEGGEA